MKYKSIKKIRQQGTVQFKDCYPHNIKKRKHLQVWVRIFIIPKQLENDERDWKQTKHKEIK